MPVIYKGKKLDCSYRLDIAVEDKIILELKAVEQLQKIHEAQLLTYLKLSGLKLGLLLNFNVPVMRDGMVRIVNNLDEKTCIHRRGAKNAKTNNIISANSASLR